MERRNFLKKSGFGEISYLILPSCLQSGKNADYRLSLDVATRLFDDEKCWSHPRAGIVPGFGKNGVSQVVMTMNSLDLAGSDVFRGMFGLETNDLGNTWTEPLELETLKPRFEIIDGVERPVAVSDFWPGWLRSSKKLLGTGHTVVYTLDWKVTNPSPRHTSYSVYNAETGKWSDWKKLQMPAEEKLFNSGAGCAQRFDLEDGTILLPISFRPPGKNSRVTVCRCSFDGEQQNYLEHFSELKIDNDTRGLHEPSVTRFNGEYFMTIRNDEKGFVARSKDGLHFEKYVPWTFDDGSELGNYNTQQHWITHSDSLYLIYTRRGAKTTTMYSATGPPCLWHRSIRKNYVLAKRFAMKGYVGLSIDYRIREKPRESSDETIFDAVEDAGKALLWLRKNAEMLKIEKLTFSAISACFFTWFVFCSLLFFSYI